MGEWGRAERWPSPESVSIAAAPERRHLARSWIHQRQIRGIGRGGVVCLLLVPCGRRRGRRLGGSSLEGCLAMFCLGFSWAMAIVSASKARGQLSYQVTVRVATSPHHGWLRACCRIFLRRSCVIPV